MKDIYEKRLIELREDTDYTWLMISKTLEKEFPNVKLSPGGVRKRYARIKSKINTIAKENDYTESGNFINRIAKIVWEDSRDLKEYDFDKIHKALRSAQKVLRDHDISQIEANITIDTKEPIAISFISDVHIGSPYVDYDAFFKDISYIAKDPRLYVGRGGDWTDKFMASFKDKTAPSHQLYPADIQMEFERIITKELESSIIAIVGGNHGSMDKKITGIDTDAMMYKGLKPAYLPGGGLIKLNLREVSYRILWKHNYRFTSAFNKFNSHHRMRELLTACDIVVLEHQHDPGHEIIEQGSYDTKGQVLNIRTGSYKIDDPFSVNKYREGRAGPETVVLYPDKKKLVPFSGKDAISDAIKYLDGHKNVVG